jgi:hypothetical protein
MKTYGSGSVWLLLPFVLLLLVAGLSSAMPAGHTLLDFLRAFVIAHMPPPTA